MRAAEIHAARSESERNTMARLIGATSSSEADVLSSMRSSRIHERILNACDNSLMREDVALLAANPFDPVQADELVEPSGFRQIGLIESVGTDEEYAVNIDMALTISPRVALEFGFAATMLARLGSEDLTRIQRHTGLGPRPSRVDLLLDLAAHITLPANVQKNLARLTESDRRIIEDAVTLGELPDDASVLHAKSELPNVTIESEPSGAMGLVFWIAQPARGMEPRPVVPLELQDMLLDLLKSVPAAPDITQAAPKQVRKRRAPKKSSASAPSTEESMPATRPRRSTVELPGLARHDAPKVVDTRPITPPPQKMVRLATGERAAGWVDLERHEDVATIRSDKRLSADIADVIADRWIVLRDGTDVDAWTLAVAQRLQWEIR